MSLFSPIQYACNVQLPGFEFEYLQALNLRNSRCATYRWGKDLRFIFEGVWLEFQARRK